MFTQCISAHPLSRLSQLLVTTAICCSLTLNIHREPINTILATNSQVDLPAATTLPSAQAPAQTATTEHTEQTPTTKPAQQPTSSQQASTSATNATVRVQVLPLKTADLYRQIFAEQARGDFASADKDIAQLDDKRLLGHVLADRYARRKVSIVELNQWLATYADLPEAPAIYAQAKTASKGIKNAKLNHPVSSDSWNGGFYDYGVIGGFRNVSYTGTRSHQRSAAKVMSKEDRSLESHIDAALHKGQYYTAQAWLETEQKHRTIDSERLAAYQARIAASMFHDGRMTEAHHVAETVSAHHTSPLALWIAGLAAWKQNDMQTAAKDFSTLAEQPNLTSWDQSTAAFWAYRAYRATDNAAQAHNYLEQAARQPRSFYGMLANHLLGRGEDDPIAAGTVPVMTRQSALALSASPAGFRTLALMQVGQTDMAEAELRRVDPTPDSAPDGVNAHDVQNGMLALADTLHRPNLTMRLAGFTADGKGRPFDAALYPVPPWQPASGFQVDRALIYALMRHESGFDPHAVSGSGACGLMQLLPSTARLVANDNDQLGATAGHHCPSGLMDPATNVTLGQNYVRVLSEQPLIGDNLLLLLAAYNGGPARVPQWLGKDGASKDPLLFIESLPVRETHDYVEQVLTQYWRYRARLGQPMTSLTAMSHGQWPRYVLHDTAPPRPANKNQLREAHLVTPVQEAHLMIPPEAYEQLASAAPQN